MTIEFRNGFYKSYNAIHYIRIEHTNLIRGHPPTLSNLSVTPVTVEHNIINTEICHKSQNTAVEPNTPHTTSVTFLYVKF